MRVRSDEEEGDTLAIFPCPCWTIGGPSSRVITDDWADRSCQRWLRQIVPVLSTATLAPWLLELSDMPYYCYRIRFVGQRFDGFAPFKSRLLSHIHGCSCLDKYHSSTTYYGNLALTGVIHIVVIVDSSHYGQISIPSDMNNGKVVEGHAIFSH